MKISPLKDYKAPKYAAKIAALLAVTAAVSGCAETPKPDIDPKVNGLMPTPVYKETSDAVQTDPVEVTLTEENDPVIAGTVTTTARVGTDFTELAGDVAVPDDTTAVIGVGSILSALGALKDKLFGSEKPVLMGDVPNTEDRPTEVEGVISAPETDEPELMGKIPATEDTEPELLGDVDVPQFTDTTEPPETMGVAPADTDDYPELEGEPAVFTEEIIELAGDVPAYSEERDPMTDFAYDAAPMLEKALGKDLYDVTAREEMYYRSYMIDGVLFETRTYLSFGSGKNKVIYIAFFVRGSEFDTCLSADKNTTKVGEGFVFDPDKNKKELVLFVPYDYYINPLEQSVCDGIAADLKDKGFIK